MEPMPTLSKNISRFFSREFNFFKYVIIFNRKVKITSIAKEYHLQVSEVAPHLY